MALRIKDRVKQGSTTVGVGTISLDVSLTASGFQDFSVLGNGTQTYYAIEEGANFEIGVGTYSSDTLTRSTILASSNGGSKISLGGNSNVFVTYPAEKAVFTDTENNATVTGLIVGETGVKFDDGTIQTTAALSFSTASGAKIDTNTTNITSTGTTNAANITTVSGLVNTIQTSGVALESELTTVSGLVNTIQTTGVATAANLAATGATNEAAIAAITPFSPTSGALITTIQSTGVAVTGSVKLLASSGVGYSNRISTIEGSGVATAANLASTGATNAADISTVSGLVNTIQTTGVAVTGSVSNLASSGVGYSNRISTIEATGVALTGSVESLASSGITGPIMVSGSPNLVQSFDLSEGNFHTVVMTGNMTGIIAHNVTAKQTFAIRFVQDNTGSRTMTNWFTDGAGVIHTTKFAGGSAFTLTTTANSGDVFGFICDTSGVFEAFIIGQGV